VKLRVRMGRHRAGSRACWPCRVLPLVGRRPCVLCCDVVLVTCLCPQGAPGVLAAVRATRPWVLAAVLAAARGALSGLAWTWAPAHQTEARLAAVVRRNVVRGVAASTYRGPRVPHPRPVVSSRWNRRSRCYPVSARKRSIMFSIARAGEAFRSRS